MGGLERVAALKHEVFWDDENGIRSFGMLGRKGKLRGKGPLKLMGGKELSEDHFLSFFFDVITWKMSYIHFALA